MAAYRIRGRRFLFTWSQVGDHPDEHLELFDLIDAFASIKRGVIAQEDHQDEGLHYHAYVEFDNTLDRNLTDRLYFHGQRPNVKPKRVKPAWQAAANYCRKDTNWIDFGFDEEEEEEPETVSVYDEARRHSSFGTFLDWGNNNHVQFGYINAAWNLVNTTPPATIQPGDEVLGTVTNEVLQQMVFDATTRKCLVLRGPTGCGKTTWAKLNAPRPALLVSHVDDLKSFRSGYHASIIFDDFSAQGDDSGKGKWPIQSQIHLVDFDNQRSIHSRYTCAVIPAGVHKIFTCNDGRYPLSYDPAVQRRVENVNL